MTDPEQTAARNDLVRTYFDQHGNYVPQAESVDPPDGSGQLPTLAGFLERQRVTFAWKTGGLEATGLNTRLGSSTMTLGGMLKHLARFEDDMSTEWLQGLSQVAPWNDIDWARDPDWDWRTASQDSPGQLYTMWQDAVNRSRSLFAQAMARDNAGHVEVSRRDGAPSLAYILANMIEEYARHNGHADLLREAVDGLTGHDPPP